MVSNNKVIVGCILVAVLLLVGAEGYLRGQLGYNVLSPKLEKIAPYWRPLDHLLWNELYKTGFAPEVWPKIDFFRRENVKLNRFLLKPGLNLKCCFECDCSKRHELTYITNNQGFFSSDNHLDKTINYFIVGSSVIEFFGSSLPDEVKRELSLGNGYAVLNAALAATAIDEHIELGCEIIAPYRPKVILYYYSNRNFLENHLLSQPKCWITYPVEGQTHCSVARYGRVSALLFEYSLFFRSLFKSILRHSTYPDNFLPDQEKLAVHLSEIKFSLGRLSAEVRRVGARLVLMETVNLYSDHFEQGQYARGFVPLLQSTVHNYIREVNKTSEEFALESGDSYCKVSESWQESDFWDYVHLNESAATRFANYTAKCLSQALKNRRHQPKDFDQ